MILKNHPEFDFEMDYYNSDGSGGTLCGNGGRCMVAFANKQGIIKNETQFIASDGVHEAKLLDNGEVSLKMNDIKNIVSYNNAHTCYTGSPHYVKFVETIKDLDVYNEGKKIRYSEDFKKQGINVNFIQIESDHSLQIRTYERGVEDETYACGTGSVASAIVFAEINKLAFGEVTLKAKGGTLKVCFDKLNDIYTNIWLTGPAEFVFYGEVNPDGIGKE
jgi:diaminopimelate epimerase